MTFLKEVRKFCDIWPVRYLLLPMLAAGIVAGPPCILAAAQDFPRLKQWFAAHQLILLLCYFWPAVSCILIRSGAELVNKVNDTPVSEKKALMTMLHLVDGVVGSKSTRFASFAAAYNPNGADVFAEITKPDTQIQLLVRAIYSFFEAIKTADDDEIRVCLVEMGALHLDSILFFEPQDKPPAGQPADYQNDTCAFTVAKKSSELLILPDIAKELKKEPKWGRRSPCRYVRVLGDPDSGSLIVFPIRHRGVKSITYCVSVYNSEPDYFKPRFRQFYKNVLSVFTSRIELEHSLKIIKRKQAERSVANA